VVPQHAHVGRGRRLQGGVVVDEAGGEPVEIGLEAHGFGGHPGRLAGLRNGPVQCQVRVSGARSTSRYSVVALPLSSTLSWSNTTVVVMAHRYLRPAVRETCAVGIPR